MMVTQSHCPVSLPSFAELLLSVGSPSVRPLTLLGDSSLCAPSRIKKTWMTQGHRKKIKNTHGQLQGESLRHVTEIGMLPGNVLLEIFDLLQMNQEPLRLVWKWHLLVHVCRRWRQIIFESPHRLNLQLLCTYGTPARKNLGIWPALPIVIDYRYSQRGITLNDEDNIITVLAHHDRVCFVRLTVTGAQLGKMATVMQEPFPVLKRLDISLVGGHAPVLSTKFLAGSASSLQAICLCGIPCPSLPTILLSASDLVALKLLDIPPTGYVSPKAIVVGLAALPRLEILDIGFQLATSRPDQIHPPPRSRTVLPALTSFRFRGASEYLEDLLAQIDSPQLDQVVIDYFNQLVDFRVPQLPAFVDRSIGPKLALSKTAHIVFCKDGVIFKIESHAGLLNSDRHLITITIGCKDVDWQVPHIAQVLSHLSATISTVVHFRLDDVYSFSSGSPMGVDNDEWLHLLRAICTVEMLHVGGRSGLSTHVALALQSITGEMVPEVLPSLNLLCLAHRPTEPAPSIKKFLNVRKLCGRPVTVVEEPEIERRLKSFVRK